ncbi:uncharacterized protein LY89DRAFT_654533 [Mollisia scopiformis]|uniref:Uncharacterized protein n=1 Tax=Mollisia scopiformis TaxID=149040 RepID=A0A194WVQ6_MOLSC|nr:uncharacterized protein LY89DRAFT_654533 [Mollisia scopiformis]KUJ11759.1 hypothetical protein LY89DRAFT_654533 [Mollisia scopiformis]
MLELPTDFYHMVCEELANRQEFGTLFNCALSGKILVGPALLWLYSSEGNDNDLTQNDTFQGRLDAQKRTFLNWALQWKSITRSSLGNTAYPYCLWIRSLDLRNLSYLLEDNMFREAQESFFAEDMAGFLKAPETPMKLKVRGAKAKKRLDIQSVLELIGESITSFISEAASQNRATVAVEDLSGDIRATVLPKWVSRMSKLKSMTLWDGGALNADVAEAITKSCHNFDDLTFYLCLADTDNDLAAFFRGLRQNSLRSFAAISAASVGPQSLLSLNHHAQSLKRLKLDGLKLDAIKNLSYLQGCDRLESLEISDADGTINLEATENDVYLEVVAWLSKCTSLRELLVRNFVSGPVILTEVCLSNNIRLQKLQVVGYPMVGNRDFHKALSHQSNLESLELRADPEGAFRDDIEDLITSISRLSKLKYLNLLSTSDYFRTQEILALVPQLQNLEELWFGGYDVTDDIWHSMANLHHLRALNIHAVTSFTSSGILAYISTLQDTNQGMLLSVMAQSPEHGLTEVEEVTIRLGIAARIDGRFEYTLYREIDSDAESFSD